MEQPCSRCGYMSDRPARFCRQCGSQLFAESDVTSATTRNYSQQPPQFAEQPQAGYSPGSWAEQPANTSPFYQAPPPAQAPYPNQHLVAEPKKSFSWWKWIALSFITFALLAVMVGGALFWWGKQAVERAIERAEGNWSEPVVVNAPPIPGVPLPPEVSVPETSAITLDSLKYPGATVVESNKAPFTEAVSLTTDDDLETVKEYYDKKVRELFKNSNTSIQSEDDEKFVYVALANPMVTIEIQPDPRNDGKTRISIAKVKAPIPKIHIPEELRRD